MTVNEKIGDDKGGKIESPKFFLLTFAVLFVAVFIFQGKTVPFSNEFLYLLRLAPDFLPNDWTFSKPANEHWLFNTLFGFPARLFSLEVVGWAGRIAVWSACLIALIKLGRRWKISYAAIAVSIFIWLAFEQTPVNAEWIFGGFEAKTVAYACLLFALDGFLKRRVILSSILLGLSFSFHPAIGLWAILAIGLTFLFEKISIVDLSKIVFITGVFALPGIVSLIAEQTNAAANSFDDWRFLVVYRMPWHLDAFQFARRELFALAAMFVFNIFALRKNEDFARRFLLKFQASLALFFLLGLVLRFFELFTLLRFMPMRLFPVFASLFFFFTVFYFFSRLDLKRNRIILILFVCLILVLLDPFRKGISQIQLTVATWTDAPPDLQTAERWISANVPPDAQIIQPPDSREFWYFSKRAGIVSFAYPTYDRLSEWRGRVADLTNNLQISKGENANEEINAAYNNLSAEQIARLKQKYAATHLVSRAVYPYPIIFETKTYKVYQLP